jgi:putative nucleotidyltransferase with HDIG domain
VSKRQGLIVAAQAVVLLSAVLVAVLANDPADWRPTELVLLLFVLAVGSDILTVEIRGLRVSGAFLALVLAMALLGPTPAVAISVAAITLDAIISRRPWDRALGNVATYATFPLIGGLMVRALMGDVDPASQDALGFAAIVLVVFMVTNTLNFAMIALILCAQTGGRFIDIARSSFVPVLPSEFATGLLTAGVAFCYGRIGVGAVGLLAVVLFVFQYLLRAGVQAFERGEELSKRTTELASLQVGLLSTVMQTLSMRDAMTARHSAAVARYAREVARTIGVDEREQDLIHTAALLHDIGKFIFPDSILFAERKLTDDEWTTVKMHPEQGARLVRRIEGYGPVADIIFAHHERMDGNGYYGLPPCDIPVGSRIIAIADTYDVMTSRDSYRRPVSPEAAFVELRRVSGTQLDPQLVEVFVEMIESGRVAFRHADEADFEKELAFESRVEDYARPRAAVA